MEFRYSHPVPSSSYSSDGLAHGIPLRSHNDATSESSGALRAQADWNACVAPVGSSQTPYQGGLGARFSFVAVTIPECVPERLEVVSYANEYAFLYDDQMETLDLKNAPHDASNAPSSSPTTAPLPEQKLQAHIFSRMLAIDRPRATTTMRAWSQFMALAPLTRAAPFSTLASYLPSRAIDAGELFWFGMLTFGMGLTVPPHELETCMQLARPGYYAISLVNDLYSWRKERVEAELAGQDYVFNAIWVVMEERGCSEEAAVEICREKVRRYIEEFEVAVEGAKSEMGMGGGLSVDTLRYLEAVRLSYVGNLVWSIYCPRYHGRDEEGVKKEESGKLGGGRRRI